MTISKKVLSLALAAVGLSALTACVDEKIVYVDRELFEDPPSAAANFLGYSDHDAKLTVCGNCHVGPQAQWEATDHATAWADLQDSGHAQDFCNGCHTVGELGNAATGDVGHAATADARYEDVQCEACHGPGLDHVSNPADETVPLAPLAVASGSTTGCGECHEGSHHPMLEEWEQSAHGSVNAYPAGREGSCDYCHTGEAALKAWGVETAYLEQEQVFQPGEHLAITCAVCHDPHGSENDAQLRFPVDEPSEEGNLCMKCHHKRGVPDPGTWRGPHSPEGPTLLGYGGYWSPSMSWEGELIATHGSEANPKLCAGCHVGNWEVTDQVTGDFVFQVTGHTFEATPCLDEQGIPQGGADCADSERSYQTCTGAGCHGSEAVARSARFTAETRVEALVEELNALLDQVPSTEFDHEDSRYTIAEGARFNAGLGLYPGSVIHNPFLIEALLTASIKDVKATYGLSAVSDISLERLLGQH